MRTSWSAISLVVVDAQWDDYTALLSNSAPWLQSVHLLSCGETALRMPAACGAVWLVNFRLPDIPGEELVAWVKSRCASSAALLVGNRYHPDDERAALQLRGVHYACKPLPRTLLECVVKNSLSMPATWKDAGASPYRDQEGGSAQPSVASLRQKVNQLN